MTYTAKDIKVLDPIEGIRERTGMYLGSTDIEGVHQCIKEIITNSIDEALNGFGKKIWINVNENMITIIDQGRGIPFDKMDDGIPAIINIFTKTHAGGKFGQGNYSVSGGLNGVGGTAVNAVSSSFIVASRRNNILFTAYFEKGRLQKTTEVESIGVNGTSVTFTLDKEIFSTITPDIKRLNQEIQELSYLTSGVHFIFNNKEFYSECGLQDMIKDQVENAISSPIYVRQEVDIYDIEIAMQYEKSSKERIFAYTNNIPNPDGGTHVTGFKTALTTQMNKIAKDKELIKDNIEGDLWRKGLVAAISVKMKTTPTFASQTKTKLTSPEVRGKVSSVITNNLERLIKQSDLEKIVNKILLEKKAEDAAQRAREAVNRIASGGKSLNALKDLPSKLADCNNYGGELFLVEGDSAGGSAKQARDPNLQAIMPLRGKVLNTTTKDLAKILENKEIRDIVTALGCGIGERFNIKNLRYDKIIIMSDADVDGSHIALLLCSLFLYHLPQLVLQGKLYKAVSPLYGIQKNNKIIYLYNDKELEEYISKFGKPSHITRFKGLGELNSKQLWETTMNPINRRLLPLTTDDMVKTIELFDTLMGNDAKLRKAYIMENAEEGEI